MREYAAILRTTTTGVPWRYNFSSASDNMARDYAERLAVQFAGVPWFMGLTLFSAPGGNAESIVAHFTLNVPTARVSLPVQS